MNVTPPDLQALVLAHGTYDRITPEAWKRYDDQRAQWQMLIRLGIAQNHGHTETLSRGGVR